jgi:hypothetical protein
LLHVVVTAVIASRSAALPDVSCAPLANAPSIQPTSTFEKDSKIENVASIVRLSTRGV